MAFPSTPLAVRVDLQLAGVWTDITADTLARDGATSITIERGRADEASRADPSKCRLSLKNQTGKYSPRNPTSPYYGILGRNTALRVGIGVPPAGAGSAGLTGTSLAAPTVNAETSGALLCAWLAGPVGNFTVPAGFTGGAEVDKTLTTFQVGVKSVAAGATGASTATFSVAATSGAAVSVFVPASGASAVPYSAGTTSGVGVVFSAPVTAGDYVLAFYGWSTDPTGRMMDAPADTDGSCEWMPVADTGASNGPRLKAYIRRMPTTGTLTTVFRGRNDGTSDTFGCLYVITGATDYYPRFVGEVSEWPPKWDLSGRDVWTPITASGISRRLKQGAASLHSAIFREFSKAPSITAYWPMEDPAGATSFASALAGAPPPMQFLGATPTLAADDSFACADALPTFTLAGARGQVPAYTSTNQFLVGALMSFPVAGMVSGSTLLTISCSGGTVRTWTVKYDSGGPGFRVEAFDVDGVSLWNLAYGPWTPTVLGSRFFLYFTAQTSGANIVWTLKYVPIVAGVDFPTSQQVSATILTQTVGRVTSVAVGGVSDLNGPPTIGHLIVASDPAALFTGSVWQALVAWNGELAETRVRRLCTEEKIPFYVQYLASSEQMGPQRPATLLTLLGECETTDVGVLHEPKGFAGLAFRTRASMQNQTAALALSYSGGNISEPFEPTDDDQGLVNDVTANRIGGSAARATLDVGPLSTLPPPDGVGRYDDSVDLNLFSDAQLPDQAGWRVHIGTWDEARYPSIRVDLAKNPTLIGTLIAADVGDLVTLTGLPAWLPPGPNDLILEGYTETFGHPNDWDVVGNYSPAGPYRVAVLNSTTYGRLDSAYTVLNGSLTPTATSLPLLINPPAGGTPFAGTFTPWATTAALPGEFPFDIVVGGEQMTVTAAAAAVSNVQNLTVTRSVNGVVKAHVTAEAVHLVRPTAVAL